MQNIPTSQHVNKARAEELEKIVTERVAHYVTEVNRLWPKLNYKTPVVQYDLRGRTAGQAWGMKNLIKLNPILLHENLEDFKVNTIPHEIAHIVSFQLYGRSGAGHGPNWKYVMRRMGIEPSRCHQYDTTNAKVRNVAKTSLYCTGCGKHIGDATAKVVKTLHLRHSLCCKARCSTEKPVTYSATLELVEFAKAQQKAGKSFQRIAVDGMIKYNFKNLNEVRQILNLNARLIWPS